MTPRIFVLFLAALLLPSLALGAKKAGIGNERIDSYTVAKRIFDAIYRDHRETLYCGFPYEASRYVPLPPGFIIASFRNRAYGMEREHVVPVESFGKAFPEYRDGSPVCINSNGEPYRPRDCAAKLSRRFRLMYCDLHNIFPSVGSVNAKRGHREFEPLPDSADMPFGETCPMKFMRGKAEPPDRTKGTVARAYRYMDWAYKEYNMSSKRRRIMEAWDAAYPPDAWECERNRRIKVVQGNENPFVAAKCEGKEL